MKLTILICQAPSNKFSTTIGQGLTLFLVSTPFLLLLHINFAGLTFKRDQVDNTYLDNEISKKYIKNRKINLKIDKFEKSSNTFFFLLSTSTTQNF
jgi:hypothetical protein